MQSLTIWVWCRMLMHDKLDAEKASIWVTDKVWVKEVVLLCSIKRIKLAKYDHWNRRPDSLVLSSLEELPGQK